MRPTGYAINPGDCDDTVGTGGGVNPGVPENTCNGIDDDCDTATDEGGLTQTCSVDPDDDGYAVAGAASAMRMCTCLAHETPRVPTDATNTDCLEGPAPGAAAVHPAQPEVPCNGIDDDCNGDPVDTVATCSSGQMRSCPTGCGGNPGTEACNATCSGYTACTPPAEVCNGLDDDCVPGADNGYPCPRYTSRTRAASCPGFSIPCSQPCPDCNWDAQCDATTTRWVWNGNDPALGHGLTPCGVSCFSTVWCLFGPCLAAQYGPYVRLPPGLYRVTFDLRATGCVELQFDVVTDGGGTALVPADTYVWPAGPDSDGLRSYTFSVPPGCGAVEFRISFIATPSGMGGCPGMPSGNLAIRSTTLELLSRLNPT